MVDWTPVSDPKMKSAQKSLLVATVFLLLPRRSIWRVLKTIWCPEIHCQHRHWPDGQAQWESAALCPELQVAACYRTAGGRLWHFPLFLIVQFIPHVICILFTIYFSWFLSFYFVLFPFSATEFQFLCIFHVSPIYSHLNSFRFPFSLSIPIAHLFPWFSPIISHLVRIRIGEPQE